MKAVRYFARFMYRDEASKQLMDPAEEIEAGSLSEAKRKAKAYAQAKGWRLVSVWDEEGSAS